MERALKNIDVDKEKITDKQAFLKDLNTVVNVINEAKEIKNLEDLKKITSEFSPEHQNAFNKLILQELNENLLPEYILSNYITVDEELKNSPAFKDLSASITTYASSSDQIKIVEIVLAKITAEKGLATNSQEFLRIAKLIVDTIHNDLSIKKLRIWKRSPQKLAKNI